jgi:hypothetical protein
MTMARAIGRFIAPGYRGILPLIVASTVACSGREPALDRDVDQTASQVLFGNDDRLEYRDLPDNYIRRMSESTAIQMQRAKAEWCGETTCTVDSRLRDDVCPGEKYAGQRYASLGYCSAWLVGPDLLATAGHCLWPIDCPETSWVFGWRVGAGDQGPAAVPAEDVYQCQAVIGHAEDNVDDFAIVRLDRPVGKPPFIVRRTGEVTNGTDLVIEGYPLKLPLKIDQGGVVKDNAPAAYFTANLDAFLHSSGSVVFDEITGVAEGILFRGYASDFVFDEASNCFRIRTCSNDAGCSGAAFSGAFMDVQKITRVPNDVLPLHPALIASCTRL